MSKSETRAVTELRKSNWNLAPIQLEPSRPPSASANLRLLMVGLRKPRLTNGVSENFLITSAELYSVRSISKAIESVPPLRLLDSLGRVR